MKLYVDTNVWLDHLENRSDRIRPLGEFAFSLFKRALECEHELVISDFALEELSRFTSIDSVQQIFWLFKKSKKLVVVKALSEDKVMARHRSNFPDALHAIIARREQCDYIVTRNIEDFIPFFDLIQPILPENV